MTISFDPGADFARVTDGLAPVTLARTGSPAEIPVDHALCRAVRTREARKSGGRYTAANVVWYLPAAELPAAPVPGDVLVEESGLRWTVLDVQQTALRSCWRCVCRWLAIAPSLDQEISIEKADYCKSPAGSQRAVWRPWRSGVRARIQPIGIDATDDQDRDASLARFLIFCEEDHVLDHTYRVRGPDGTVYRILASRKSKRIDALLEIRVVQTNDE